MKPVSPSLCLLPITARPVRQAGGFLKRCGLSVACLALLTVIGCGSSPQSTSPSPQTNAANRPDGNEPVQPLNQPAGESQSMQVVAGILLLGLVPYDNMTLPLISPNGRFVATQCGAPPTWPTALAELEEERPEATRVEIYELDLRENIAPSDRKQPALIATVPEPVMLGRSCDAIGFLIESVRDDGSRWIGKASWTTGEIDWLVNGPPGTVNAFASMGHGGRLAWSRRPMTGGAFDLVVFNGTDEFTIATTGDDWVMPTWSGHGNGLFVFAVNDGNLDLRYGIASSPAALRQSMQRLPLATESDIYTAYQAVSGQPTTVDPAIVSREQLVFFHPGFKRVAVWRPLAMSGRQGTYLNAGSVAALVDQEDVAFVATDESLVRQHLRNPDVRIQLVGGPQIPRATASAAWPYMLLNPGERHVGLTAMRLLPRSESIIGGRANR